jgi:hypothetical protein
MITIVCEKVALETPVGNSHQKRLFPLSTNKITFTTRGFFSREEISYEIYFLMAKKRKTETFSIFV